MSHAFVVLGAGGHAKVVVDTLLALGHVVQGCTDRDARRTGDSVLGAPVLGTDDVLSNLDADEIRIALGLGYPGPKADGGQRRLDLMRALVNKGFGFPPFAHPATTIGAEVLLDDGVQIMAGAVVQPGSRIGAAVIVNTGVQIDHDCNIGEGAHLAPGAILAGNVGVGALALVGVGAVVLPGRRIGARAIIGAGAVIVDDVAEGCMVVGNPAKVMMPMGSR